MWVVCSGAGEITDIPCCSCCAARCTAEFDPGDTPDQQLDSDKGQVFPEIEADFSRSAATIAPQSRV
jgi:hypothetical protein